MPRMAPRRYQFLPAFLLLAVVTVLWTADARAQISAETLFVSVDPLASGGSPGDDSKGNGSRFAPYREISHAMLYVVARNTHVVFVGPSRGSSYSGEITTPENRPLKIISEKGSDSTYITGTTGLSLVTMYAWTAVQVLEGFTIADKPGLLSCHGACPGAVYAYGRAWIINNKIMRNIGEGLGGGITYDGMIGTVGIIAGNWIAKNSDAGIRVNANSNIVVLNNTIVGNSAATGAGIYLGTGVTSVTIANNLIAYNSGGYGIYNLGSPGIPAVIYNLFYQNGLGNTLGLLPLDGTNLTGPGANPFLFDRLKEDYHLTCGSPARNAGYNKAIPSELSSSGDFTWDIDGPPQGRIFPPWGAIDIGGDEFWDTHKIANFDATPTVGCNSMVVSFSNLSTCINEHFIWDFGDGTDLVIDTVNPIHTYKTPGHFTVRLIAKGDLDSDTLTKIDFIRIASPLSVSFTADTLQACDSLNVTFTAVTNTDADSLRWTFGDGGTALGNPVTHKFTKIGTFDASVRAYNPCGDTSSTRPAYITISTKPVIDVAASSDSVQPPFCIPFPVRLHPVSGQPLTSWEWDFGDSDTTGSKLENPIHVYNRAGTFSVRLIAAGSCGSDTAIRQNYLTIETRPTATFDANPKAVCAANQSVSFTATYQGLVDSSFWLFGDGNGAPGPNTTYRYRSTGVYQPHLILFHHCAVDTLAMDTTLGVGTTPNSVLYGSPRSGFEPLTTFFADSSRNEPTAWGWDFGDGSTSTAKNPSHIYSPGVWRVKLTVSNICGSSVDSVPNYIRVGGFVPSFDSAGVRGDSILYNVLVDTLIQRYDRPISLSAALTTTPRRGTARFMFDAPTGTPRFTTTMKMVPTGDLATGDYTIRLSATDPRIVKTADRTVHFIGRQFIAVTPDTVQFGKLVIGGQYSKQAYIVNRAPLGSGYRLDFTVSDSGQGFTVQGSGSVNPQESTAVTVAFYPSRRGNFLGTMTVSSNDPALPLKRVALRGRGTPDLVLPRITATVPEHPFNEIRIDSTVRILFSKPVIAPSADSLVIVSATRSRNPVGGVLRFSSGSPTRPWTWLAYSPSWTCESGDWFPPDDTLRFRIRAVITDTSDNGLDGDSNAIDEGSPTDDYLFAVSTGPGVRPGDADQDLRVDERDIVPLARYWGMTGPRRTVPVGFNCPHAEGFVVQPAFSWDPRAATHADANGDGVIDSADICPIAEFFDRAASLPKSAVDQWMNEARTWDRSIVQSLVNGLINCPQPGAGQSVLLRFLRDVQSGSPVPTEFALGQNYPNPFNPTTVIEYSLKTRTQVRLEIFDILGRLVSVLEDGEQEAGKHSRIWDGTDSEGRSVASGIYFYRLATPEFRLTRKMVLMK